MWYCGGGAEYGSLGLEPANTAAFRPSRYALLDSQDTNLLL